MPLYQSKDPYSALSEGLERGASIGGNIFQIKADRARQKFDQEWRQFQSDVEIAGNKNLPKEMRLSAINTMIDFKNKLNPTQTQGEHLTDLPSYSDEMFKKIKFVKDDEDKDIPEKLRIINMLVAEYADTVPHAAEFIKPDIKDLERQERSSRLGQGRRYSDLRIGLMRHGGEFAVERFKETGEYPKEGIDQPTIKSYFNKTTGDTLNVNEENPAAVEKARSTGYMPYEAGLHGKQEGAGGKSGLGQASETDFRQYINDARGAALKTMKFNDPSQLALILAMVQNPEKADAIGAQLERSMTAEQIGEYKSKVDSYIGDFAPDSIVSEYQRRTTRTPEKKVGAVPGKDTALGQINKEIGKTSPLPKEEVKKPVKPRPEEPGFWENSGLSGLDLTGRRGMLEPVIRAYLAGKMTEQGLSSALYQAGLQEKSVGEWVEYIKGFK